MAHWFINCFETTDWLADWLTDWLTVTEMKCPIDWLEVPVRSTTGSFRTHRHRKDKLQFRLKKLQLNQKLFQKRPSVSSTWCKALSNWTSFNHWRGDLQKLWMKMKWLHSNLRLLSQSSFRLTSYPLFTPYLSVIGFPVKQWFNNFCIYLLLTWKLPVNSVSICSTSLLWTIYPNSNWYSSKSACVRSTIIII